jgi:PEP-CTERM motif
LLATLNFDSPPEPGSHTAFAGITATEGVTSFHWQATNGQYEDTGIDNIFLAGAQYSVPEPSTWAMMLLGFGVAGLSIRRRRAALA